MLVEVGALISWCIYSYRIVMLLVPYMWASMTFLPRAGTRKTMNVSIKVIEVLFNNHSLLFFICLFIYIFIYFCGVFQVRMCVRAYGSYAPGSYKKRV